MNRILKCRFFLFCSNQEFLIKKFNKHLRSQGSRELKDKTNPNGKIIKNGYFNETLFLLSSLEHGIKHKTDKEYKKESKNILSKYSLKEVHSIFKKYPYLFDLKLIQSLIDQVHKEKVKKAFFSIYEKS